mmetsp:Transcript_129443/g.258422  ORF Transcript_129443/g.258422 Transcript_129443/m.258422 type:complete len:168 (+) Transcript_129443:35-538(+)
MPPANSLASASRCLAQVLAYSEHGVSNIGIAARLGLLEEVADTFDLSLALLDQQYGHLLRPDERNQARTASENLHGAVRRRIAGEVLACLPLAPELMDSPCSVCLSELTGPEERRSLPCGHVFHSSCLQSWFNRRMACPTCRCDPAFVLTSEFSGAVQLPSTLRHEC